MLNYVRTKKLFWVDFSSREYPAEIIFNFCFVSILGSQTSNCYIMGAAYMTDFLIVSFSVLIL